MFVPVEQLAGKSIGQYKLTKLIGRSVLSAVYEAASSAQASSVMLTVFRLPDECVGEAWELFMERFEDEASRLRGLQHPHVVPYYEFGEEFGYPYLITPLTANRTLADLLKRDVCTPVQMLQLLKQIASGLDYIHSSGIVHGSLKPSNILLRVEQDQPRVLIANVGLAQILEMRGIGEVSHSHPHLFNVAGTLLTNPAYLAPEVVRGAPSDRRSDMYALGILIYEMLCGRPPFIGSDPMAVALQHVDQLIPPLRSLRPELPPALDGALRSVLERDPARRILQAEKLVSSLERIIITLQESSKGNLAPMRLGSTGTMKKGMLVEKQWQGMPGVTGDKMPSLVPEFMSGAGIMAKKAANSQFKLPSSDALPPIPPVPLAPPAVPAKPATTQRPGQIFKPPMALGSGVQASSPPSAQAAPAARTFQPVPAKQAQVPPVQQYVMPPTESPLVTVIASGAQAKQMLPSMPSSVMQNVSPYAAPSTANAYTTQMAASQQYAPTQAPVAQGPDMNYSGWAQAGSVGMGMPANPGMQAGAMYDASQYAQQQYMDAYGQGYWVQHEQDLQPVPDKGRRRAVAIVGGAVVAAVLGAGGINLLRMMQNDNNNNAPQGTGNNQTQAPSPATTGQQQSGQPNPAPANKKVSTVIANQKNLATNAAQDFTNPIDKHAAILVHLPDGKFAAYDKACTHQGVAVAYDPQTNKLVCPLHHSIFDPADNGKVVHGPAFLRLPAVQIQVNGDGTITVEQ